jgi:MerR family transcriptional regulator, redox-sensitive transcriptional activator SoxR
MLIGELARRAGMSPSAIRFYEAERLILPAGRRSGRRVFDDRSIAELAVVALAKEVGFTLAEIRQLVREFGRDRWRRLARRKLSEMEAAADRLRTMTLLLQKLLRCGCPDIEFCGRLLEKTRREREAAGGSPRRGQRTDVFALGGRRRGHAIV